MREQLMTTVGVVLVVVLAVFGLAFLLGGDKGKNEEAPMKPVEEGQFFSLKGKPAPEFTLPSYDGGAVSLKDFRGKNVVLFFNEGLRCYPACWNQTVALAKDKRLNNDQTTTLNITVDKKEDWQRAVVKMPELAAAKVLLDTERTVSGQYGVLSLPSSMHKGSFPGHTYVIIDKEGIIRYLQDDSKMGIWNDRLVEAIGKF